MIQNTEHKRRQPSKSAKRRVKEAFDAEKLCDICVRDDFTPYAERFDLPESNWSGERFYYYKDNGSDILAVAHLDTVQGDRRCSIMDTSAGLLACSGALDDRLGAYVILELLPKLGITCDWLLTTGEEHGQSTAECFETNKKYNWMIEFDRGGTDVVMYQYEDHYHADLVEESGAQMGVGSYSDICELDFLGVVGFNWGVGYRDYHSSRSHAWLEDTFRMVARFEKFHKVNGEILLDYEDTYAPPVGWNDKWDDSYLVADCGHEVNVDDANTFIEDAVAIVCRACGTIAV